MMPFLVLFDIDGTLLRPCGLGRRSLERAFAERYGRAEAFAGIRFHGRTDFEIVSDGLAKIGAPSGEAPMVIERYLQCLEEEIAGAPPLALPGVPELLRDLAARPGVVLGLVTGNVRRGAEIKLRRDGLLGFFAVGAFGDDSNDRGVLVALARERAMARGFGPFAPGRVAHVSDTEVDIQAARAGGVRAVAVATGPFDRATLAGHRPDHLFDSLEPSSSFLAEVLS